MKSSRTLSWAALCLLPLVQQIAQAQPGSPAASIGQPSLVLPADVTPALVLPTDGGPDESAFQGGDPRVPNMLSSPLGAPVAIQHSITTSRTVLTPSTVTTPTPVTTTTLQTQKIRVVHVMSGTTVISFRTVTVPVTTTTTVNKTSTVTTPQTVTQTEVHEYRIPSVGGYRISDNESPLPQTRVFYTLNDFQSPFDAANTRLGGNASIPDAVRNTFGFEQAFLDGMASFGLRLPINTLKVDSSLPGAAADDTSIGDLFLVSKVLLYHSESGNVVTTGLGMTLPTGRRSFAGADQGDLGLTHHVDLQPYLGYIWRPMDRLYVQGFSSIDVPMNASDVTVMYNDVGVGYFAYLGSGFVTALAPTLELRATTPLNHDGVLDGKVFAETQIIQCLAGLTVEMSRQATLTVGAGVPLTGPKPYDWMFLTQINFRF